MERLSSQVELILGPMFGAKSTELIRRLRRYGHASKKTLLLKWTKDVRYSQTHVMTHDQDVSEKAYSINSLEEFDQTLLKHIDVLGVDEGQFFTGLNRFVRNIVEDNPQLIVIVAALASNSKREPFGEVWELGPIASKIEYKTGICSFCKFDGAAFTARLIHVESEVHVGGAEVYQCACEKCYRIHNVL